MQAGGKLELVIILAIIAIGRYFIFSKNSPLSPQSTNSQSNQQVPPQTTTTETAQISKAVLTSYDEIIAACYPKNEGCSACQPILNNSEQRVVETERRFINVPKDFYPKEISSYFTTVSGNATAGWISNGGLPGEGLDATPDRGSFSKAATNLHKMAQAAQLNGAFRRSFRQQAA